MFDGRSPKYRIVLTTEIHVRKKVNHTRVSLKSSRVLTSIYKGINGLLDFSQCVSCLVSTLKLSSLVQTSSSKAKVVKTSKLGKCNSFAPALFTSYPLSSF